MTDETEENTSGAKSSNGLRLLFLKKKKMVENTFELKLFVIY
jgi:hypothetical protein